LVIKNDLEADNYVGKVNFILNKDIFETNKENISFWQSIYLSVFKDKIREIRMEENEGKNKDFSIDIEKFEEPHLSLFDIRNKGNTILMEKVRMGEIITLQSNIQPKEEIVG